MNDDKTVEKYIESYPFRQYIKENQGQYRRAKDAGYKDPNDFFMIGESGGFLLDIRLGDKFVNTNLLTEMANIYHINGGKYTLYKVYVPKGYRHMLITNIASWNGNVQTANYT